jgi:hypothetical protein
MAHQQACLWNKPDLKVLQFWVLLLLTSSSAHSAMPKRSNNFQRLVYLIQRTLSPNWEVSESVELLDRQTGKRREVDVVVRGNAGPHPLVIGIECVARKRKATIEWVEQQAKKHETLTDKLILVSERGFYRDAEAKAKLLGIQTHTLGLLLKELGAVAGETITVGWVRLDNSSECHFEVNGPTIEVDADSTIFSTDGTRIGSINSLLQEQVENGRTIEAGQQKAAGFGLSYTSSRGSWVQNSRGERMLINALHIRTKLHTVERTIQGALGEFAGHPILYGLVEECSPPLSVLFVTDSTGQTTTIVDPPNIPPPPEVRE